LSESARADEGWLGDSGPKGQFGCFYVWKCTREETRD
jgi:hypothetical protein